MIFGQLSNRESLRDLVLMINAHQNKAYHLGFGKGAGLTRTQRQNVEFFHFQPVTVHQFTQKLLT